MRTLAGAALALVALLFSLAGGYVLFLELTVAHKDTLYWAMGAACLLLAALSAIPAWLVLRRSN